MKWELRENLIGVICVKCSKYAPDHVFCKNCDIIVCMLCVTKIEVLLDVQDPYPHLDIIIKGVVI